jgi:PPM family protein phosphatase
MQQVELTWGVATHVGLRAENQDRRLAEPPVFAVADGMGGHEAGAEASAVATTCLAALTENETVEVEGLRAALRRADDLIRGITTAHGSATGAGTTVAGLALLENGGAPYWAAFHIGDSRVYRWGGDRWERISTDHSVVQELLDDGSISPAEALTHPQRHVITRALGVGAPVEADFSVLPVVPGERLLLCSDGLTGAVGEDRIEELMVRATEAPGAAQALVDEALAGGAADNVSAVVIHVGGAAPGPTSPVADEWEEITIPRVPAGSPGDAPGTGE